MKPQAVQKEGPRVNREIDSPTVQLITDSGDNKGTVDFEEALALAEEAGLDLVEISPNNKPPVCKILDFGKYKYQAQKKAAEARKKQKTIEIKEIKMRPNIDTHDYEVKMKAARRFFEEGDKVKVKLLGFDDRGKVRLSMKHVNQETGEEIVYENEPAEQPREKREGGGGRGRRRDRD